MGRLTLKGGIERATGNDDGVSRYAKQHREVVGRTARIRQEQVAPCQPAQRQRVAQTICRVWNIAIRHMKRDEIVHHSSPQESRISEQSRNEQRVVCHRRQHDEACRRLAWNSRGARRIGVAAHGRQCFPCLGQQWRHRFIHQSDQAQRRWRVAKQRQGVAADATKGVVRVLQTAQVQNNVDPVRVAGHRRSNLLENERMVCGVLPNSAGRHNALVSLRGDR